MLCKYLACVAKLKGKGDGAERQAERGKGILEIQPMWVSHPAVLFTRIILTQANSDLLGLLF